MARIEWVKQRLENWALWKERGEAGSLGYPSASSFLREAVQSGFREANIPVDAVEASITDEAVRSLQLTHSHIFLTLQAIYVQGIGVEEAARRMSRARSTIVAQLDRADVLLAEWFAERKRRQERRSFTP